MDLDLLFDTKDVRCIVAVLYLMEIVRANILELQEEIHTRERKCIVHIAFKIRLLSSSLRHGAVTM